MATDSNITPPAGRKPPQFGGLANFLVIVVLVVAFFLLAQSMARHRFHEGDRLNRNGTLRP